MVSSSESAPAGQAVNWAVYDARVGADRRGQHCVVNGTLGTHDGAGSGKAQLGRLGLGGLGALDVESHTEHFDGASALDLERVWGPTRAMNEEGLSL